MTVEELKKALKGIPKTAKVEIVWEEGTAGVLSSSIKNSYYHKFEGTLYIYNDETNVKDAEGKEL